MIVGKNYLYPYLTKYSLCPYTAHRRLQASKIFVQSFQTHSIHIFCEQPVEQPNVHFDLIHTVRSAKTLVTFKSYQQMEQEEREMFYEDLLSGSDFNLPNIVLRKDRSRG
ncbi:hypothetical protein [Paenibacillus marinisediminis]